MGEEGHPEASGHGSAKRRASRGLSEFPRWENERAFEPMPRASTGTRRDRTRSRLNVPREFDRIQAGSR